ncbi:MAG: hypothetical protein N3A66_06385 [Planctomycetota bacterium]|nr:hypothetical protein [Planctomycetota bacterium]
MAPTYFALATAEGLAAIADGQVGIFFLTWSAEEKCLDVDFDFGHGQEGKDMAAALVVLGAPEGIAIRLNSQTLAAPARLAIDGHPALIVPLRKEAENSSAEQLSAQLKAVRAALGK